MQGGPLGKNFRKKMTRSAKQIEWGDPLVLPGMVCYAEKHGKPFWSRSLGQIMQFDTIIFVELSRTILVSSCG